MICMMLHDLAHVAGWEPYNLHHLDRALPPGLDLQYTDPAQRFNTADSDLASLDLDDLDRV